MVYCKQVWWGNSSRLSRRDVGTAGLTVVLCSKKNVRRTTGSHLLVDTADNCLSKMCTLMWSRGNRTRCLTASDTAAAWRTWGDWLQQSHCRIPDLLQPSPRLVIKHKASQSTDSATLDAVEKHIGLMKLQPCGEQMLKGQSLTTTDCNFCSAIELTEAPAVYRS